MLPARGEAEFDMMVTTNFVSSFGRLLSRVGGGKLENIDYEIAGKVLVDKGMCARSRSTIAARSISRRRAADQGRQVL